MAVILAAVGALFVAVGAGLVYLPAGLVVGGAELLAAAYVVRFMEARQ